MQRSDGFCRVNRRQNESGVLRGGMFFLGNIRWKWWLSRWEPPLPWQCSKWARPYLVGDKPIHKNGGIYKKNTTVCRMRQEGFGKFIEMKREKYDTSCDFRKNTLCESEQTPVSVCGKSFYCQLQQDVACASQFWKQLALANNRRKKCRGTPLRWLGKTNLWNKNSTPTGHCQAETDRFIGTNFFRCGKRFASSMPQRKLQ